MEAKTKILVFIYIEKQSAIGLLMYLYITNVSNFQARIAFLQGERKGQENLKQDLVRRIKMLEFALKQERYYLCVFFIRFE